MTTAKSIVKRIGAALAGCLVLVACGSENTPGPAPTTASSGTQPTAVPTAQGTETVLSTPEVGTTIAPSGEPTITPSKDQSTPEWPFEQPGPVDADTLSGLVADGVAGSQSVHIIIEQPGADEPVREVWMALTEDTTAYIIDRSGDTPREIAIVPSGDVYQRTEGSQWALNNDATDLEPRNLIGFVIEQAEWLGDGERIFHITYSDESTEPGQPSEGMLILDDQMRPLHYAVQQSGEPVSETRTFEWDVPVTYERPVTE